MKNLNGAHAALATLFFEGYPLAYSYFGIAPAYAKRNSMPKSTAMRTQKIPHAHSLVPLNLWG